MAVELARRARRALRSFIGLGTFQTAYWLPFMYGSKTALLHCLVPRSDDTLPRIRRESADGVERPVMTEEKVNRAALECFGAMDHAVRLWTLQIFSHLHALLQNNTS